MNNDTIFLYILASIALCFGLINCIQFLLKRNRTAQTTGTIISIKMPKPETAKARNSKWAQVYGRRKILPITEPCTSAYGFTSGIDC